MGQSLTPEQLGERLRYIYYEQYEKEKSRQQGWAEYTARQLIKNTGHAT